MKLTRFEIEVLRHLLKNRLIENEWHTLLSNYVINNVDFTGAGYFLDIICSEVKFERETIHRPVVRGRVGSVEVGFLLFVEGNSITIECHGWGDENPPKNIRDIAVQITVEEE